MTVDSAILGGMLSLLISGYRSDFLPLFVATSVGLVLAHASSNLFNDYWDSKHGIDSSLDYFRPAYLPHPSLSGMMSQRALFLLALVHLVAALIVGFSLTLVRGPGVLLFAGIGAALLLLYAGGPFSLKKIGLGEISVVLVWGPLMVGGTYYILNGTLPGAVILASLPYALSVSTVLMGKHIDKLSQDKNLGVHTLPVIFGESLSRSFVKVLIFSAYLLLVVLVAFRTLPIWSLVTLFTLPRARAVFRVLDSPKPSEPPRGYSMWPIWFLGYVFWQNRRFGMLYFGGLALALVLSFAGISWAAL
jgi:1,4-dihydroxy-2-naphthoate octaprenyltransferase